MQQEPENPDELRKENEFLKIKLMLEHGADFSDGLDGIDPRIENQFLKNIDEFERKFSTRKKITVYEKLGSPVHFRAVEKIPKSELSDAWHELMQYMNRRGVSLDVCSPNVSEKEMYRFVTEELFREEMDDIDIGGMTCSFIYDEFHPDHRYENSRVAVDNCMDAIFGKHAMEWMHDFSEAGLQLNRHQQLSITEFKKKIADFKSCYNALHILRLKDFECTIEENTSHVNGLYKINALLDKELLCIEGSWMVQFEKEEKTGWWKIVNVQVSGLDF